MSFLHLEKWFQSCINPKATKVLVAVINTNHAHAKDFFSTFQTFFNSGAMGNVRETFCIYHVTAPGQEPSAEDLPEGFVYPTMDELSEQVSQSTLLFQILQSFQA